MFKLWRYWTCCFWWDTFVPHCADRVDCFPTVKSTHSEHCGCGGVYCARCGEVYED